MDSLMGLINLDHEQDFLNELTYFRCGAAVPFGGRYRLIDFTLSNMVKTNIHEVAIFTRNKYRSLMDHLGTGANWELDRRHGGLFILPPDWNDPTDISKGDLRHFHNNRDYFNRGKANYVLISGSQFVSNNDYKLAFKQHLEQKADITLVTIHVDDLNQEHDSCLRISTTYKGMVTDITYDKKNHKVFTGVYIISKELLLSLVDECIAHHHGDFFYHGIKENLDRLHIQTYEYKGYSAFINSVESFYRHNMNLLYEDNYKALFSKAPFIRTKVSNEPPTKYRKQTCVSQSLLANGCVIDGEVSHSVLFRGVTVEEGAIIKNSVIMQRCTIESGAYLENVILDKDVHITANQKFIGAKEMPYVIAKRKII
ncbi:glucose-1-phosphate adenylyltransferase subunit GlgD [Bacillus solitudinis]|uniref:glucose-1-phosphate adenylyltransferase subunit GlgD n=1 Tax=Bacillus solitudinis TaxID=2014074 RepID=UPI000C235475|nr:glucose-1-phosphate adenylyltransferase subunit GlgD [Bacillus solitudinis]